MAKGDAFDELLRQGHDAPLGDAKVALLLSAVREADFSRGLDEQYGARLALIRAAVFSGRLEHALPAFGWCLAKLQREPEKLRQYEHSTLWYFKSIARSVVDSPHITLEQCEGMLGQLANFYQKSGYSLRTVEYTRFKIAVESGDSAGAEASLRKWRPMDRDALSDCLACEVDLMVEYHALQDDSVRAIETAAPCLERKLTCGEVPHRTMAKVLRPLARSQRYDEGDRWQRQGYNLIRDNKAFLLQIALHLFYLVHRGRGADALRLVERHLDWSLNTYELQGQYYFNAGAEMACRQRATEQSAERLRLPTEFPLFQKSGEYELAAVADWFGREWRELGARFDARNGRTFFVEEAVRRMAY